MLNGVSVTIIDSSSKLLPSIQSLNPNAHSLLSCNRDNFQLTYESNRSIKTSQGDMKKNYKTGGSNLSGVALFKAIMISLDI